MDAGYIVAYLNAYGYIDHEGKIQPDYHEAVTNAALKELPASLKPIAPLVTKLVRSVTDPSALAGMIVEVTRTEIPEQRPNKNFDREEFQSLWHEINYQYVYMVHYNSDKLIQKSIDALNAKLVGGEEDALCGHYG